MKFFNLTWYERRDLEIVTFGKNKKKYNCFTPVKLNLIDKIVEKEHKYGWNRICPFGIWIFFGMFIPFWLLLSFIFLYMGLNSDFSLGISIIICFFIGAILEVIYNFSCDKIDYNSIIKKNQQMNLFNDFGVEYKYSDKLKGRK